MNCGGILLLAFKPSSGVPVTTFTGLLSLCISETGQYRFRRAQIQTPNPGSFLALRENSVSFSQPVICVRQANSPSFFCRAHRVCCRTQSVLQLQDSTLKQYYARFLEFSSPLRVDLLKHIEIRNRSGKPNQTKADS